jgi:beta-galactosidase
LEANDEDVAPIDVAILDADGNVVSNAVADIGFTVSGNGSLAGVADGDPVSHESNAGTHRATFHGLAMVLVRANNRPGAITVQAHATGLPTASITLESNPAAQSIHHQP